MLCAPVPGEGCGQVWVGPAARRVGGWWEAGAPGGLLGKHIAHNGVWGGQSGAVVHRVRWAGTGGRPTCALHDYCDFSHFKVPVWCVQEVERRVQLGYPSQVSGPCLAPVLGCVHREARPQGVQQGRGAAVEGGGRPLARQPQRVPNSQGPAQLVRGVPVH